jgi:NAD(P)-dependent dehydrogenase (short-subunit alcohol dehydrogenase family)
MDIPPVKSMLDFTGKVAVITGSGSGVGQGIAARFAQAGASVVIHYRTSAEGAEQLRQRLKERGARVMVHGGDLTRTSAAAELMDRAVKEFGSLDVLVNNAGTFPLHSVMEMTPEEWREVVDANLLTVHLCTQAAARHMKDQTQGGAIVNITTIEAENPAPLHAHYDAAKGGVLMYTRAAANELAPYGIRVNAVAPGLIWREGIEQAWPDGVERWLKSAPLKRLGLPEDVADACLFLASPAARWITGASLTVDGGVMTHQIF